MTAGSTDRLHHALAALDAARTIGDPAVALSALDALDAESAALRGIVTAEAHAAGHKPLPSVCLPAGGQGKVATAETGTGQHAITDHRTRRAGH